MHSSYSKPGSALKPPATQSARCIGILVAPRPSTCTACHLDASKTSCSGRALSSTCTALRRVSNPVIAREVVQVSDSQSSYESRSAEQQQEKASSEQYYSERFASMTRLLMVAQQPQVRAMFTRAGGVRAGPIGLLFFLFGLVTLFASAVRQFFANKVRGCRCCKGYGIVRCTLCEGTGSVGWSGKMSYKDGCPMCMSKRYADCPDCGGMIKRRLFPMSGGRSPLDTMPSYMKPKSA